MPNRLSLREMAARIRSRELSPVALVEAHLAEIERRNPVLNAFVEIYAQQAREAARQAEQGAARGGNIGPLHGIPVTVKDSFDLAGRPTFCGSRYRASHRARQDAAAVQHLRAAGAIVLGKTNCPEFLMNWETDNAVTGRTNHPLDPALTPGGSSGGESAAIAAFCSAGGVGSDGGGSIRVPAHFTGIAGLKPTPGRVSAAGHFPQISHPGGLLGVAGPMARTVEDVRVLFEVLAGYDPQDPFSAPVPLRFEAPAGLRVGVLEQFFETPVMPEVRAAVQRAAALLAEEGIPVEEFRHEPLRAAPDLWWFFFGRTNAPLIRALVGKSEEKAHWTGVELMHRAEREPPPQFLEILENLAHRDKLRASVLRKMESAPVLLTPACGVVAFPHGQRRWETAGRTIDLLQAMEPLTPWNLLGFPALSVPMGFTSAGLPVGVQIVGRPWEEDRLLELGARLEDRARPSARNQ